MWKIRVKNGPTNSFLCMGEGEFSVMFAAFFRQRHLLFKNTIVFFP